MNGKVSALQVGVSMKLYIDVLRDHEAHVFVATSKDLNGLVAEAETIDELISEIESSVFELAKAGVSMKLCIDVLRDHEANVFVATSKDLNGLVAEAETIDELISEIESSVSELLNELLH